jgi:queuine tRNA-ribosyltransferase
MHNLRFILRMMEEMREAIVDGTFEEYRQDFHARFTPPDQKVRREQRLKWLSAQGRPGT